VKFRELWRVSSTVTKEVSFQSVFSTRAGSSLPRRGSTGVAQLVRNAKYNMWISKVLTTIFICAFGFVMFIPQLGQTVFLGTSKEFTIIASVSTFLAAVLFFIVFMGLQVATSLVSSKIADTLSPLPLSKKEVSKVIFLCLIRIFDLPLLAALVVLPTAYLMIGGSIAGGSISVVATIVTEIFALALTIGLARFFYSKVAGGGGRSKWKTVTRFLFMLVWMVPAFGTYFVINFAEVILKSFASFTQVLGPSMELLVLVFPFSFGFLVSYVSNLQAASIPTLALSTMSSVLYVVFAFYCFRWVTTTIRSIGTGRIVGAVRETVKDTIIRPRRPWLGIIRKDLAIASRSPSYAVLFLLPALQVAVLAVSFSSFEAGFVVTTGVLTGISMTTLVLPPTMFSIEGLASSYTRSLPLRKRTLILAKTLLAVFIYSLSVIALLAIALFVKRDFTSEILFGALYLFSIAAASMLELTILARKFWKEGFALGNVYARLSTFMLILVPGYALAWAPMIAAFVAYVLAESFVLPVFLGVALAEFIAMSLIVYRQG
jgi:predicted permease